MIFLILIPAIVVGVVAYFYGLGIYRERKRVALKRREVYFRNQKLPEKHWDLPPALEDFSFQTKASLFAGAGGLLASMLASKEPLLIALFLPVATGGLVLTFWFNHLLKFEAEQADIQYPELPSVPEPTPAPIPASRPPFEIPDHLRMEHTLVLGGTGAGKTQLLSNWIAKDIFKPCSLIVFDSQGDLLNNIVKVDFPRARVVLIDPTDVRHPVALSLFDFKSKSQTDFDREKNFNSVVELLSFVLQSLGSETTPKQELTLRMLIRLCLVIPDATIHTLREVLSDSGFKRHQEHVAKLGTTAQAFFRDEYLNKSFGDTREQIARRVYSILEVESLERMFSSPTSRLDMGELMDNGSIILINTAKSFLKEQGSVFFTRFMTALIFQAIQERNPGRNNTEVYLYIDEAAPVISGQTATILETARKYKLGLTLAFQSFGQVPSDLQHSVIANTSIKAVGGISAKDARALAEDMGTRPETLMQTPKLSFFVSLKGGGSAVVPVRLGELQKLAQRSDYRQLLEENRARYCVAPTQKPPEPPPEPDDPMAPFDRS